MVTILVYIYDLVDNVGYMDSGHGQEQGWSKDQ